MYNIAYKHSQASRVLSETCDSKCTPDMGRDTVTVRAVYTFLSFESSLTDAGQIAPDQTRPSTPYLVLA
jgi:hypothetical protein